MPPFDWPAFKNAQASQYAIALMIQGWEQGKP